jgi:hypothetical protein
VSWKREAVGMVSFGDFDDSIVIHIIAVAISMEYIFVDVLATKIVTTIF